MSADGEAACSTNESVFGDKSHILFLPFVGLFEMVGEAVSSARQMVDALLFRLAAILNDDEPNEGLHIRLRDRKTRARK
jgi:hypothetical protein